jgi:hypothetical protein
MLCMVLKVCACSTRCWANFEVWLFLNACLCSLYRAKKLFLVWPFGCFTLLWISQHDYLPHLSA